MKFFELTYNDDVKYDELYKSLEDIGDFIIDKNIILFYCNRLKRKTFSELGVSIKEIDVMSYNSTNKLVTEWLIENYRKFRVEKMLKDAEVEKQEDLKNLYNVIKSAEDIINRKEDLVGKK